MRCRPRSILLTVAAISLLGCQTSVEVLGAHSVPALSFKRTLVLVNLGAVSSSALQCQTEVDIAQELTSLGAAPTCSTTLDSQRGDVSQLLKSAAAAGYDGVLSLKLLSGSYDKIPEAVWDGQSVVGGYSPGSTTAVFGASVFSLNEYRLLWTARVTRHNADPQLRDVRSVQRASLRQLRNDGLVP